jgi:hypothetical protein
MAGEMVVKMEWGLEMETVMVGRGNGGGEGDVPGMVFTASQQASPIHRECRR